MYIIVCDCKINKKNINSGMLSKIICNFAVDYLTYIYE